MGEAQRIIDEITSLIIQPIVVLLFSLGTVVFLWGLVEFIANPTDPTKKKTGQQHIIYGVLGLLIMVSIWGIVGLVTSTLGIECKGKLDQGQPCGYTGM